MTTTKERTRKISSNTKRKRNSEDSESSPSHKSQSRLKREKKENPATQDSVPRGINKPWQNNGTYVDMDVKSNSLLIVFDFKKINTLMNPEDREIYLPFLKDNTNLVTSSV